MPIDQQYSAASGSRQYALLDAIRFPIDRDEMLLEQNDLVFLLCSDDQSIIAAAERALFEDQSSAAYIGDLFALTSVRKGFVGVGSALAAWRSSWRWRPACWGPIRSPTMRS